MISNPLGFLDLRPRPLDQLKSCGAFSARKSLTSAAARCSSP